MGDRSQFTQREPFLARVDRGLFRRATDEELERWRADRQRETSPKPKSQSVGGQPVSKDTSTFPVQGLPAAAARPSKSEDPSEWHTEAQLQSALVAALVTEGWRILSVANTATKEHGVDVVAVRDGQTVGVEVKGFPSRRYADPARATETKRTTPSTQAGHWYAQAVLAATRLRGCEANSQPGAA